MRQDAIVLQLVGMMDDIWRSKQLDLRMVTFRCMPVGYRKGAPFLLIPRYVWYDMLMLIFDLFRL